MSLSCRREFVASGICASYRAGARSSGMGLRLRLPFAALVVLALPAPAAASAAGCDPLDSSACLYPWPNDYFTKADSSTATGKRLDLSLTQMPTNLAGVPIDPTAQNRNDGF